MTYVDQMNYKDFISDPDAHIKNTQIINFEIIHTQYHGQPCIYSDKYYQTITLKDVRKVSEKDTKKAVGACLRSTRKEIFVEKILAFS